MPSPLLGKTLLNQYRIEEFFAQTPLGECFRAVDTRTAKSFALTILPAAVAENIEALKAVETAATSLRAMAHPNIIPYLGVHQTPTLAYILEAWVDGPSVLEVLAKSPIGVREALIYIKSLCAALEVLHARGLLHLNLAPELIRVDRRGAIALGGLAFAQPIGARDTVRDAKYPPRYLAPEQFRGQTLTPATDTYALAVLVYQLLTGVWINGKVPPKTNESLRKAHLELTPPAPNARQRDIPDHFSRMMLWALRKKPADRLKTTTELLTSLCLAAGLSVDEVPLRADPRTGPATTAILNAWQFLPTPKPNLILQDTAPLEDRLATLIPAPLQRRRSRIGILPLFLLAMLAGVAALFWIVRPAPTDLSAPIQFTPFASNYTPPPTASAAPRPTDDHGGRIAFTCTRGDYNQLCMINPDGSGLSQLTDMQASNYYPTFSPDGGSLVFASNRNGAFDLYAIDFGAANLIQLTQNVGNVISPDYSPDGREIVFANRAGSSPTSIWETNADGSNARLLYAGSDTIVAATWSPDGSQIAYAMSVGIAGEYEIYTMDANGKHNLRISHGMQGIGGSLDWSPDGHRLLIYAGPVDDKDLFEIDANSGDSTQLTRGGNNAGGAYSPDGRSIVFNSLRNHNQADLYIMNSDGSGLRQLTNDPQPDWGAQWAP